MIVRLQDTGKGGMWAIKMLGVLAVGNDRTAVDVQRAWIGCGRTSDLGVRAVQEVRDELFKLWASLAKRYCVWTLEEGAKARKQDTKEQSRPLTSTVLG